MPMKSVEKTGFEKHSLKNLDSFFKQSNKENTAEKSGHEKLHLKEASINRLGMMMKTTSEYLSVPTLCDDVRLDYSVMNEEEGQFLQDWANGKSSGLFCMVALLNARKNASSRRSSPGQVSYTSLMGQSVDFSTEYLVKKSKLYENLFSQSPVSVVKKAVALLLEKTMENAPTEMRSDQIALAMKQLRVERIAVNKAVSGKSSVDSSVHAPQEDEVHSNQQDEKFHCNSEDDSLQLEIMMELVCMHKKGLLFQESVKGTNTSSPADISDTKVSISVTTTDVLRYLKTTPENILEELKDVSIDTLDAQNNALRIYITRVEDLKKTLKDQLEELQDSEAYLTLGVSKNAPPKEIKKAYHKKAVQLHPDRKGGDTAKFQALQTAYNEVCEKKKFFKEKPAPSKDETSVTDDAVNIPDEDTPTNIPQSCRRSMEVIRQDMAKFLATIRSATEQVASMAQLGIQGLKMMESLFNDAQSLQMAPGDETLVLSLDELKSMVADETGTHARMGSLITKPMETLCDALQSLAMTAMEIARCGLVISMAAARNFDFSHSVEVVMSSGLQCLSALTSVMETDSQLSEVRAKLCRVTPYYLQTREEIHANTILMEMTIMSYKSLTLTMNIAAEKAVAAAEQAIELCNRASAIENEAETMAAKEEERKAAQAERAQDDVYYSKQNTEAAPKSEEEKNAEDEARKQAYNEQKLQEEEERKQQLEEEEEEREHCDNKDEVDQLKYKVKKLQTKVCVQHVQSLQCLNAETVSLQEKLQMHVVKLDSKICWQTSSAAASNAAGKLAKDEKKSYRKTLVVLMSELLDSSCANIRKRCHVGEVTDLSVWKKFVGDEFFWLSSGYSVSCRIALFPDVRTRILSLAVLDGCTPLILSMIKKELRPRLLDILFQCRDKCAWAFFREHKAVPPTVIHFPPVPPTSPTRAGHVSEHNASSGDAVAAPPPLSVRKAVEGNKKTTAIKPATILDKDVQMFVATFCGSVEENLTQIDKVGSENKA